MKDHFLRMVTQKVTRTIEDEETGETHEEIVDQFYHPDDADVQAEIQNILGMIDNIPFLEASGFDAIPRAMNAADTISVPLRGVLGDTIMMRVNSKNAKTQKSLRYMMSITTVAPSVCV